MFQVLNYLKVKLKKQDGMEMLQVLLISGIVLVLIITVFFPFIQEIFNGTITNIRTWFTNHANEPFK